MLYYYYIHTYILYKYIDRDVFFRLRWLIIQYNAYAII